MKILITGFEPFGEDLVNPSYEAVKMLPSVIDDCEIHTAELPVCFGSGSSRLLAKVNLQFQQMQPDL